MIAEDLLKVSIADRENLVVAKKSSLKSGISRKDDKKTIRFADKIAIYDDEVEGGNIQVMPMQPLTKEVKIAMIEYLQIDSQLRIESAKISEQEQCLRNQWCNFDEVAEEYQNELDPPSDDPEDIAYYYADKRNAEEKLEWNQEEWQRNSDKIHELIEKRINSVNDLRDQLYLLGYDFDVVEGLKNKLNPIDVVLFAVKSGDSIFSYFDDLLDDKNDMSKDAQLALLEYGQLRLASLQLDEKELILEEFDDYMEELQGNLDKIDGEIINLKNILKKVEDDKAIIDENVKCDDYFKKGFDQISSLCVSQTIDNIEEVNRLLEDCRVSNNLILEGRGLDMISTVDVDNVSFEDLMQKQQQSYEGLLNEILRLEMELDLLDKKRNQGLQNKGKANEWLKEAQKEYNQILARYDKLDISEDRTQKLINQLNNLGYNFNTVNALVEQLSNQLKNIDPFNIALDQVKNDLPESDWYFSDIYLMMYDIETNNPYTAVEEKDLLGDCSH